MTKSNVIILNEKTDLQVEKGISELAQNHAQKLYEEFREEAFISTMKEIEKYMSCRNWTAIKSFLEISFMIIFERTPIALSMLMENDADFQTYSKYLYERMKAYE